MSNTGSIAFLSRPGLGGKNAKEMTPFATLKGLVESDGKYAESLGEVAYSIKNAAEPAGGRLGLVALDRTQLQALVEAPEIWAQWKAQFTKAGATPKTIVLSASAKDAVDESKLKDLARMDGQEGDVQIEYEGALDISSTFARTMPGAAGGPIGLASTSPLPFAPRSTETSAIASLPSAQVARIASSPAEMLFDRYCKQLDDAIERGDGTSVNVIAAKISGDQALLKADKLKLLRPTQEFRLQPSAAFANSPPEREAFDRLVDQLEKQQ